jgi:integrase
MDTHSARPHKTKEKRMAREGGKDRGLFQRKGNNAWWIRWSCPYGHEHMEKIGPKSLARQVYEQRRVAVKVEGFCLTQARERQRREQSVLFRDVARRYLAWSQEHRPRSYTFRQTALKHLIATFGTKPLSEITRANVEAYQSQRRHDGVQPGTINRERSVLSHLFTKAQAWGLVQSNPVLGTDRLQEGNERPRPLSQDEEARLFAVIPTHYKPVVTLALHTGLRLGELRTQTWRDVDLATSALRVTRPKSKKHEVIPLNSTAFAVLAALPQDDLLLFPHLPRKLSDLFIRYVRKAGLSDVTFHCLRDTYISRLAQYCTTPTLMALARHRDYRTTRRYVQVDGDHLRQAVEHLVPEPENDQTTVTLTVTTGSNLS